MPHLPLRVPATLIQRVDAAADRRGVTRSIVARNALEQGLTFLEAVDAEVMAAGSGRQRLVSSGGATADDAAPDMAAVGPESGQGLTSVSRSRSQPLALGRSR